MKAIHVNSTTPFFARNKDKQYSMEKTELYCAVISALQWRKSNGEISLVTDKCGSDYIFSLGLEGVWNEVLAILPDDSEGINPHMFWAAGKLLALRDIPAPVALVDMDFIVWNKLSPNGITAAHREELMPHVYPPKEYFGHIKNDFLASADWNVLPCNTAFVYFPDEDFKQYYTSQAIRFMKTAPDCDDYLCHMVFAEQRMLSMCAEKLERTIDTLLDKNKLFVAQDSYTHLWGAKQQMRENKEYEKGFLHRCRQRIAADFPDYAYVSDIIDRQP